MGFLVFYRYGHFPHCRWFWSSHIPLRNFTQKQKLIRKIERKFYTYFISGTHFQVKPRNKKMDQGKRHTFLSVCWSESFLFTPDITLVLFASSFKGGTKTLNFGLSSNFSEASKLLEKLPLLPRRSSLQPNKALVLPVG